MKLTIGCWNVADHGFDPAVARYILASSVDIWVLIEGYPEDLRYMADNLSAEQRRSRKSEAFLTRDWGLYASSYEGYTFNYNDVDGRLDRHGYIVLVRKPIADWVLVSSMSIVGRECVKLFIDGLTVYAMHFHDRPAETRKSQMERLGAEISDNVIDYSGHAHLCDAVLMGDFNTAPEHTLLGWLLNRRAATWLIGKLPPASEPGVFIPPATNWPDWIDRKLRRLHSLLERLASMTSDQNTALLKELQSVGLTPTDKGRGATMLLKLGPLRLPVVRLDYILTGFSVKAVSGEVSRPRGVKADHRPVQASIEW